MNKEIKRPEATEPRWPRWDYKTVWTNLSDIPTQAKMVIAGSEDEEMVNTGRARGISEAGRLWTDRDECEQGVRLGVGDKTRLISDCILLI